MRVITAWCTTPAYIVGIRASQFDTHTPCLPCYNHEYRCYYFNSVHIGVISSRKRRLTPQIRWNDQAPLLLIRNNFNPSMDKWSHAK